MSTKSRQLQIRVTPEQKAAIRRLARSAGQDLSTYVLSRVLPSAAGHFAELVVALSEEDDHRYLLAELSDLLASLSAPELSNAVALAPLALPSLSSLVANYVAAMVEQAAQQRDVLPPTWVREVPPLEEPYFVTPLPGLRLHLLKAAPVPFKRRNIFVDSAVGARI